MISRLLLNGIFGILGGFIWALALDKQPKSGLLYGLITGAIIGLVLYSYSLSKSTKVEGNVTKGEASFAANMQSILLLVAAIATALATWTIRLIFF